MGSQLLGLGQCLQGSGVGLQGIQPWDYVERGEIGSLNGLPGVWVWAYRVPAVHRIFSPLDDPPAAVQARGSCIRSIAAFTFKTTSFHSVGTEQRTRSP